MAKKKKKGKPLTKPQKTEVSEMIDKPTDEPKKEEIVLSPSVQDETGIDVEAEEVSEEEELVISPATLEEIGTPDREQVFLKVAKAYEEAKQKREKYKKIGPALVFITGVLFLTLMFTLDNKILFLILWVITVLYTAALMIRAEYKYHQFRGYLGLSDEDSDDDECFEEIQPDPTDEDNGEEDSSSENVQNESDEPHPDQTEKDQAQLTEQEEQK